MPVGSQVELRVTSNEPTDPNLFNEPRGKTAVCREQVWRVGKPREACDLWGSGSKHGRTAAGA